MCLKPKYESEMVSISRSLLPSLILTFLCSLLLCNREIALQPQIWHEKERMRERERVREVFFFNLKNIKTQKEIWTPTSLSMVICLRLVL